MHRYSEKLSGAGRDGEDDGKDGLDDEVSKGDDGKVDSGDDNEGDDELDKEAALYFERMLAEDWDDSSVNEGDEGDGGGLS
ncbi:hypothetical protein EON63_24800 [archaeon]|nr:MAG: hypothetical protein EON63_24800 [archaeon]